MPINPKQYIDKLINALEGYGKYYNISSKRFFSPNTKRYCTKYVLEDCQTKEKLEVYNKLEILKYLVREFSRETGRPVPESCLAPLDDDPDLEDNEVDDFIKEREKSKKKEWRGRPRKTPRPLETTGVSVLKNFGHNVTKPAKRKKR